MSDKTANFGDELFGTPMGEAGIGAARANPEAIRAAKPGDLIPGERTEDPILENGDDPGIPDQEEFYRSPARFGSVPVDQAPLGWDRRQKFNKLYPFVSLPTQVVDRVAFGNPTLEPNRLFWGDNLHVMRQLPSESIDLIYIDPPFFSGRHYNVVFGDQNEIRSFSDLWGGGMTGYLEWLNARLFEMKRLLKPSGSIYAHLDWHAVHYVKQEMDKVFSYGAFLNDIAWLYGLGGSSNRYWPRKHDSILWYSKTIDGQFFEADRVPATSNRMAGQLKKAPDFWDIPTINNLAHERIGYPTQKPELLLERVIRSSSPPAGVVADFFVGGGTTAAVAQRLGRRWIACDQSRVAVAVTADRLAKQAEQSQLQNMTGGGGCSRFHNRALGYLRGRPPLASAA